MSSATVKRARVTARIAQAENTSLPTSSENTQQLLQQTEEKRKQLDRKCSEYEQICKKVGKLKNEKNRLETDQTHLTIQCDEIDEAFTKLEQTVEASLLSRQQKNNEMNEAVEQWNGLDGKEEKLYDELVEEQEMLKQLKEKYADIQKNVETMATEAENDEKERFQLETAFETDLKTEKTLEKYLTRLIDDVFTNQRRLEDIRIGTSRGRADFRQAEKMLRDQKKRHRRMSSQLSTRNEDNETESVFDTEENQNELKEIENLENAWNELQEKIRLKEFDLADETDKMNERLKQFTEKIVNTVEQEEKQQQMKIAKDYVDLQSQTPMYAAYTAHLNLNQNLVERLEIPESRSSTLPRVNAFKTLQESGRSSQKSVEFVDELDEFPEFSEMLDNRKKILRATTQEANRVLHYELKELDGFVSGQRQEVQAMERDINQLKEGIQLRQADVHFYEKKTGELLEKAKKEDEHKLQLERHKLNKAGLSNMELLSMQGEILQLRDKRIILENERKLLTNQIKDIGMECDRLNDEWRVIKGFSKSINPDSLRSMTEEIAQWKTKTSQLREQIAKLQKMEDYASLANGQLRTNLALLKPYDEEYQEFENLVEADKRLNDQLARHEFERQVEESKFSGNIKILP